MLSAHNSNALAPAGSLEEKYHKSSCKELVDDIQGVIFSFANRTIKKCLLIEHLGHIKHKSQLQESKDAIAFIFAHCEEAFEIGLRLLSAIDSLKDSLALALGNQITYFLVRASIGEGRLLNEQSDALSTLKKLVILNYMLAQQRTPSATLLF